MQSGEAISLSWDFQPTRRETSLVEHSDNLSRNVKFGRFVLYDEKSDQCVVRNSAFAPRCQSLPETNATVDLTYYTPPSAFTVTFRVANPPSRVVINRKVGFQLKPVRAGR